MTQTQRKPSSTALNVPSLVAWRIQKERANLQKFTVHRQLLEQLHEENPN